MLCHLECNKVGFQFQKVVIDSDEIGDVQMNSPYIIKFYYYWLLSFLNVNLSTSLFVNAMCDTSLKRNILTPRLHLDIRDQDSAGNVSNNIAYSDWQILLHSSGTAQATSLG